MTSMFSLAISLLLLFLVQSKFDPYKDNSGTIVGIAGKSFVLLAADSRLSEQVLSSTSYCLSLLPSHLAAHLSLPSIWYIRGTFLVFFRSRTVRFLQILIDSTSVHTTRPTSMYVCDSLACITPTSTTPLDMLFAGTGWSSDRYPLFPCLK